MTILLILIFCSLVFSMLFLVLVYKASRIGNPKNTYSMVTRRDLVENEPERKNSYAKDLF